jgi:hypothetical protein
MVGDWAGLLLVLGSDRAKQSGKAHWQAVGRWRISGRPGGGCASDGGVVSPRGHHCRGGGCGGGGMCPRADRAFCRQARRPCLRTGDGSGDRQDHRSLCGSPAASDGRPQRSGATGAGPTAHPAGQRLRGPRVAKQDRGPIPVVADGRVIQLEGVPPQGDRLELAASSDGGGGLDA